MSSLLITQAHLLDPVAGELSDASWLEVADGRIVATGTGPAPASGEDTRVIDAAGATDQCKCAESEYRKGLRGRHREEVGEFAAPPVTHLSLVESDSHAPVTSENVDISPANVVEAAVMAEIQALGPHRRPGLVATAVALARVLDNPKAISTQPAAAGALLNVLNLLHKGAVGGKPKLATVRRMTRPQRS
jgi:hypothetical protein